MDITDEHAEEMAEVILMSDILTYIEEHEDEYKDYLDREITKEKAKLKEKVLHDEIC